MHSKFWKDGANSRGSADKLIVGVINLHEIRRSNDLLGEIFLTDLKMNKTKEKLISFSCKHVRLFVLCA